MTTRPTGEVDSFRRCCILVRFAVPLVPWPGASRGAREEPIRGVLMAIASNSDCVLE